MIQTRLVTFANNTLAVEYSGTRAAKIVEHLYGSIAAVDERSPFVTYRLTPAEFSDKLRLYRDDVLLLESSAEAVIAELLLGDSCYYLAAQSCTGLLFHSAGLAWQDAGLILPGQSGTGKTTLTAWLLVKGFDYLTDELVLVPAGTNRIQTFPRPLNLKRPSRSVLQQWLDFTGPGDHVLAGSNIDLVSPTALRPGNRLSEPVLRLIVFPQYRPDSEFSLTPLSRAQTGLELMKCLINARNLPGHGFPEVTRLARQAPAYRMRYSSFTQIGQQLEDLLQQLR